MPHKDVLKHLIHIFEAVADACDGGDEASEDLKNAYNTAMRNPQFVKFYGKRVDLRSKAILG